MRKYFTGFDLTLLVTLLVTLFILASQLSFSWAAVEYNIGVSPPVLSLENVERETTEILKFFIVTPSTETLLVRLDAEQGNIDFFSNQNYKDLVYNYSEEDVLDWVEFLSNPVELGPNDAQLETEFSDIRGWREISFLINIPEDSEPGYHLARIKPVPTVPSESVGGVGARVIAVTAVNALFRVEGNAIREGIVIDVVPRGYSGANYGIDTFFENTGNVTISARAVQRISQGDGFLQEVMSGREFIRPGEMKMLRTWFAPSASGETYDLNTIVDYTTGYAEMNSTIDINEPIPFVPPSIEEIEFPWWLVWLIIILILAIIIYKWYGKDED